MFFITIGYILGGKIVDSLGPRKSALAGAICIVLGYLLSYLIELIPTIAAICITVGFGLFVGIGCGFMSIATITTISKWFPDRQGLATGLALLGAGLSPLLISPIIVLLINTYGVTKTFLIISITYLLLLVTLSLLLQFPTNYKELQTSITITKKRMWIATTNFTPKQMVKTPTFYLIWFAFMINSGIGLTIINNTVQIAMDVTGLRGEHTWLAILAVQVSAIANACGRPLAGLVCDRLGPENTLAIILALHFISLFGLFPKATCPTILYSALIISGIAYGGCFAVIPALTAYYWGVKYLGQNYGICFSAYGIAGLALPMVITALLGSKPKYENYIHCFHLMAGLVAIMLMSLILYLMSLRDDVV
jgi:OFA family oxalate/formate antiporter-like MFS transporter